MQSIQQLLDSIILVSKVNPSVSVSVSDPLINQIQVKQKISEWVDKQGKHWPVELTSDAIINNLNLVHLPYWVLSGQGFANWSASIGVDRQVLKECGTCSGRGRYTPIYANNEQRCDNCAGSGKALATETFWSSQSGFVEASVNNRVRENFDKSKIDLQCGDRNFKINRYWVDDEQKSEIQTIPPHAATERDAMLIAQDTAKDELRLNADDIARGLGYVRNLQLVNIQVNNLESELWFYPLYLGYYSYETEILPVHIDAITGKFWVKTPKKVKSARTKEYLKIAGIIALIIAVIYAILWLLNIVVI